ncbi:hypothetical protein M752DRAFT_333691 [Aspergillus phoenicis ATCC 13157]|uniref:Uncharacterized protein n=1 Tax=Aspergillus phoenicis ATCC 13157 TaxID=1353007 RepID=A0A370PRF3_ASPPH|nr:hypothetical protein M752DRAFT_333691 [Aspergillus phoenicis ATCC 13157]
MTTNHYTYVPAPTGGRKLRLFIGDPNRVRGYEVVIRQRVSRRPQQQQMLDINSSSSSSAILARSNHPSSVARYQPTVAS